MGLRELARRTGIDRGHLSRVERGLAGLSDEHIGEVAHALAVPNAAITASEEDSP
jgi:transcriptional regulator with XRE-family HTH domain